MDFNIPVMAIVSLLAFVLIVGFWILSKKRVAGLVIISLYMILVSIMGLSYDMPDYGAYKEMYEGAKYFFIKNIFDGSAYSIYGYSSDVGYSFINSIFYEFGLNYEVYKFLSSAIGLGIIFYIFWKTSHSERVVLLVTALYVVYPFFINIIQVRNFYAEIMLLLAMYIYAGTNKYNTAKFIGLLVIGATLHPIALVYIPFCLIVKLKEYRYFRKIYKMFFIAGLALPLYWNVITSKMQSSFDLLMEIQDFSLYNLAHYASYLEGKSMQYTWLSSYGFIIAGTYILYSLNKQIHFTDLHAAMKQKYLKNAYEFFKYLCVLLPIFPLGYSLERIPQNAMIMLYLCVAISLPYFHKQSTRFFMWSACFLLAMLTGMAGLYNAEGGDSVMIILENNYLFDCFTTTMFM